MCHECTAFDRIANMGLGSKNGAFVHVMTWENNLIIQHQMVKGKTKLIFKLDRSISVKPRAELVYSK